MYCKRSFNIISSNCFSLFALYIVGVPTQQGIKTATAITLSYNTVIYQAPWKLARFSN